MADYIQQKKILEKIVDAEADLIEALRKAPFWLDEVLDEIRNAIRKPTIQSQRNDSLPGSTEAILNLLRENPRGLPAGEIVSRLVGKIRTKSLDEKKLLYAVLVTLVRNEKLEKTPDGRYVLPS